MMGHAGMQDVYAGLTMARDVLETVMARTGSVEENMLGIFRQYEAQMPKEFNKRRKEVEKRYLRKGPEDCKKQLDDLVRTYISVVDDVGQDVSDVYDTYRRSLSDMSGRHQEHGRRAALTLDLISDYESREAVGDTGASVLKERAKEDLIGISEGMRILENQIDAYRQHSQKLARVSAGYDDVVPDLKIAWESVSRGLDVPSVVREKVSLGYR